MSLEIVPKKNSWIQKTADVCGGDACIRDTRITVWGLVEWKKLGLTDPEITSRIQGLTEADLQAAWDYYKKNTEEIEQAIRENEEA
jgi:uncharacterized protein (DUF433 family)